MADETKIPPISPEEFGQIMRRGEDAAEEKRLYAAGLRLLCRERLAEAETALRTPPQAMAAMNLVRARQIEEHAKALIAAVDRYREAYGALNRIEPDDDITF